MLQKSWILVLPLLTLSACDIEEDDTLVFHVDEATGTGVDLPPGEPYEVDFSSRAPLSLGYEISRVGHHVILFTDEDTTFCAVHGDFSEPSQAMDTDLACARDSGYPGNHALWTETFDGEQVHLPYRAYRFSREGAQWLVWIDDIDVDTPTARVNATAELRVFPLESDHTFVRCRI